jgi:hypothetical protein
MTSIRAILPAVVCMCGLATAQQISTQYDQTTDFSKFHTYKWITVNSSEPANQIMSDNIVGAVDAALAGRGMVRVEQNPDLLVGFQTALQKEQQLNYWNDGGPWMGGYGSATTSTINVGTLVLDMYDPDRKKLIWRGSATKTLDPSSNAEKKYKNLEKAADKLLKHFPPKPGK